MKLRTLMVLFIAACVSTGSGNENFAPQRDLEIRIQIAQSLKTSAIKDLTNSQHIALCEPRNGLGQVIRKVIRGRALGPDFVGQLQIGQLWNASGFPMRRILAFERFQLGDVGVASGGSISCTRYFPIDDEGRIVISEEYAVYLGVEELIRILEECKKSKPVQTHGDKPSN